ncbi:MAG: hypothetical protein KGL56_00170 [Alphaproteobacteria bacterium]|nr:hypothetical protein [Alphaproteobacteria bacterium]
MTNQSPAVVPGFEKHRAISWDQHGRDIDAVIMRTHDYLTRMNRRAEIVIAVQTGGLALAAAFLYAFNLKHFDFVRTRSYDGDVRLPKTEILQWIRPETEALVNDGGANAILVDDNFDTGGTIRAVLERLPNLTVAVANSKRSGASPEHVFGRVLCPHIYYDYPSERTPYPEYALSEGVRLLLDLKTCGRGDSP